MSARRLKAVSLSLLVIVVAGCVSPSRLTRDEMRRVVDRAREVVHESRLATAGEQQRITQNEPAIAFYFLARPYADYSIRWRVGDRQEIVIVGRGDLFRLEGARVERK